jgi:hypothetical protein
MNVVDAVTTSVAVDAIAVDGFANAAAAMSAADAAILILLWLAHSDMEDGWCWC